MDLTQLPFQVGDRVRIIVDCFLSPYDLGSEWTITDERLGAYALNDGPLFLIPSDLELVERAS